MDPKTVIKLELSLNEVDGVLAGLGELPTSSGAFPLMMKIRAQASSQLPAETKEQE